MPAIGFSLLDYSWKADFNQIKSFIKSISLESLKNGIPTGTALNVNFPKLTEKEIRGIKICNQAKAHWIEKFDKRTNPQGREYYWLTGEFINNDNSNDSDEWALKNGYISIVPIQHDLTNYSVLKDLQNWNF